MTKIEKALKYARAQINRLSPYVWGGQGQLLRKLTLEKLAVMEQTPEDAGRVAKFVAKNLDRVDKKSKIFDCSGYVIECLIYGKLLPAGYDARACDLQKKYQEVSKTVRRAGDLAFKVDKDGRAYHVGIMLDADHVAEAKGRDYGVVCTPWSSDWAEVRRVVL